MSDWIVSNTHLRKKPFSFEGFEFQRQIADDMHHNLCCIKCSQIGLSEIQIRKFFGFLMRTTGIKGIFTFPTDVMFKRFSSTRVKQLIEGDEVFNKGAGEKPVRQVGIYQVGSSYGFLTGNKEGDATSIDADFLMHDEFDLSDQEILGLFNSRLQASSIRIKQKFSTPTHIGARIDKEYTASDQHEYLVECVYCRHHNIPKFTPDFIEIPGLSSDLNDLSEIDQQIADGLNLFEARVMCERCHQPLDLQDPNLKHWVPRHPDRSIRGYSVKPLGTGRIDIPYIVEQLLEHKKKDSIRYWYNTVLGEAHTDSKSRLNESQIRAVMKGSSEVPLSGDLPLFLGIDVGLTCHVIVIAVHHKQPAVVRWMEVNADDLVKHVMLFMEHHNVIAGCMDRHPYTPLANEIRDLTQKKIVPVEYRGTVETNLMKDEFGSLSHIQANRTMMLDVTASSIRKLAIDFTGYGMHDHMIVHHLMQMVREENDEKPATWIKIGDEQDHWFHALAMGLQAVRMKAVIDSLEERDPREMVIAMPVHQSSPPRTSLGVTSHRKATISLGRLN